MARTFDPIELELLWRRLISAVDEAAVAMVRTSFSTLARESYDFSCVITDETGQSLVQASESIPSFIGTLPETVKHFRRFFPPDKLEPRDVERIREYINDQFLFEPEPSRVPVDTSLFGRGLLDSAHMVDIIMFHERTFGLRIPSTDIIPENFDTIVRMAAYVDRMVPSRP